MKIIILEDGTRVEISNESYEALQKAATKPVWKNIVSEKMLLKSTMEVFKNWGTKEDRSWLNNKQSQKEFEIYLHMLLWKSIYDKGFVPNWEDNNYKYYLVLYRNNYFIASTRNSKHIMQVFVSSREKAVQMLEDLKSIGIIK